MLNEAAEYWRRIKGYRILAAILAALLFITLSWIATYFIKGQQDAWVVVIAAFVNLSSTAMVFVVASMFAREETERLSHAVRVVMAESQDRPTNLAQINWPELIENASEIDFVVQGWDRWADKPEIANALAAFFAKNGHFRLYVCHPDSRNSSINRTAMEKRLGKTPAQVVDEIIGTRKTINETRPIQGDRPTGQLTVFETDNTNWYFAALFGGFSGNGAAARDEILILSIYSHAPGLKPWLMPAMQIQLEANPQLKSWFHSELEHLKQGVPKKK